ncbi:MAG: AAA family ATPase [Candidatus Bathyarchaeia archaeon]
MGAAEELEQRAIRYAEEAVMFDRQGKKDLAIESYKKAIDNLLKIVNINPTYELNKIYIQRVNIYKTRIKVLQDSWSPSSIKDDNSSEESGVFDELILREAPKVKWEDIVGLEDAKKAIKEAIIYPSIRPDIFPLGWPKGILLFGPPGCGKTLLAAAVANEIKATFISVDAASIMSKWLGEAERNVARLFSMARKASQKSPSIIFIDELDSLMSVHRLEVGGETRVRNQFLKEMDGIIDKNNPVRVYVVGSTNKPWNLDLPFIRRFQKRIYVPPPDYGQRLETFKLYTKCLKLEPNVNLEELAKLTEGFSGSDIMDICQSIQLKVNSELFEAGITDRNAEPRKISMRDCLEIIAKRKPSISKDSLVQYEKWFNEFKAL